MMTFIDNLWVVFYSVSFIISVSLLFLYGFAIICEIPYWIRGWKLYCIAKKYNLTFVRARKGWKNGWLSLRAGERNIIEGVINGISLRYSDLTLIQGSLTIGTGPSIAIQGSEWDLNRSAGKGFSVKTTKINDVVYNFLSVEFITKLFEKIANGEIVQESQMIDILKTKDFSRRWINNYSSAGYYTGIIFFILGSFMIIIGLTYPAWIAVMVMLTIIICTTLFLVLARKLGKPFSCHELTKYPGQDGVETRIKDLDQNTGVKIVEVKKKQFKYTDIIFVSVFYISVPVSFLGLFYSINFLMSKFLGSDVILSCSSIGGTQCLAFYILFNHPWILVVSIFITIFGWVKAGKRK